MKRSGLLAAVAILAAAPPSAATTLRWSSQGDYLTADPFAQNEGLTNSINSLIYDRLVMRGRRLELLPGLATSWSRVSPTVWIFTLRKGVKWQDGTDFTADDVVFSIKRAQGATSNFKVWGNAAGQARKIDAYTVELTTPTPNLVLPDILAELAIMSRAWCEQNGVLETQDFVNQKQSFAATHAMGTGPYILVAREPDVKSVFKRNPAWWGWNDRNYGGGNVDDVVYTPIKQEGTREAALLSGEIDFVLDPPVQDIEKLKQDRNIKVYEGREDRIIFLGMDQARDELLSSNVKGKNPFKDRRVRLAFYQAIDVNAIQRAVMRGLAVPTAVNLPSPEASGIPKDLDRRYPYDLAAAKKLLAEAGYPDGFEIGLDCPNNRYINDEKICVAVAGMLAKIGITVKVNAMPRSQYFPKGLRRDVSFFLLGWGSNSPDAIFTLQPLIHSRNDKGDGDWNWGNYRDAQLDALIDSAKADLDPKRRQETIVQAMKYHHEQVFTIPLHIQVIPWAARANVEVVHLANNALRVPWIIVK